MIAATMAYGLIVALLCTLAGIALERVLGARRLPRRGVWLATLVASVALPCVAIFSVPASDTLPAGPVKLGVSEERTVAADAPLAAVTSPAQVRRNRGAWWPALPVLDSLLRVVWMGSAGAMYVFLLGGMLYFRPRARGWNPRDEGGERLWITERTGPAVFGFMAPWIVIPRWLLDAPPEVRSLVIQHEREHIAGRDPFLLTAGLLLVSLAPWNVALWWQLRRLRFAIEVDCDSRVLSAGVDALAYGRTLLTVGQQQVSRPLGAVALGEPVSQLEQRIRLMVAKNSRHSLALTGVLIVLATSLGASAAALDPPSPTTELRKLPPSEAPAHQLNERLQALVKERYPQLLQQKVNGTPVVNVLFKDDGSVDYSNSEIAAGSPEGLLGKAYYAEHLHMPEDEVAYVGIQGVLSPVTGQVIWVTFTQRKRPDAPPPKNVLSAPDTRSIDRSLVQRYFPGALQGGVSAQIRLWVLFDSEGNVLSTGTDTSRPAALTEMLETEYPGIRVEYITATPVTDEQMQEVKTSSGEPLQIFSLWLEKGQALPPT